MTTGEYRAYHTEQQREHRNRLFENNEEDLTREVEYKNTENVEIKEEIIEDDETTGQQYNKEYESQWYTVDIKETHNSDISSQLPTHQEQKIQESEQEPERKFKCEKCARTYTLKQNLKFHQKYQCGDVLPQFSCKYCNKRFKQKSHMTRHMRYTHLKPNLKSSKTRHNCDECSRSYAWPESLYLHKRVKHAKVKPQFTCDFCGRKINQKHNLAKHIISCHVDRAHQKKKLKEVGIKE
ncbi:zinc finger protein 26-like [Belonocnema kinseyi]|uniref:zinc finger protein 26-like n=1 Tax=Belonocnema kinseyi TaxID=2817044 RepID=UPI00143D494C|nr:zinc finger protein 26-like [Belonocnema kinseyi]